MTSGWQLVQVNITVSETMWNLWNADVVSATDNYPFGMIMPGRNYTAPGLLNNYKFGFNGQMKADEIAGVGNHLDFKFRGYDPRLGRFTSTDPLAAKYPWNSAYAFAENRVIDGIDLEGLEHFRTADGRLLGKYGISTEIRIVKKSEVRKAETRLLHYSQNPDRSDNPTGHAYFEALGSDDKSRPVFNNTDEAAIYWGKENNGQSIKNNREYSSIMYNLEIDGQGYIFYSEPTRGREAASTIEDAPNGTQPIADIHSHGKYTAPYYKDGKLRFVDNNNFSPTDMEGNDLGGYPGYLSTPSGTLQKYDNITKEVTPLREDMPSDKHDPERVNDINPK